MDNFLGGTPLLIQALSTFVFFGVHFHSPALSFKPSLALVLVALGGFVFGLINAFHFWSTPRRGSIVGDWDADDDGVTALVTFHLASVAALKAAGLVSIDWLADASATMTRTSRLVSRFLQCSYPVQVFLLILSWLFAEIRIATMKGEPITRIDFSNGPQLTTEPGSLCHVEELLIFKIFFALVWIMFFVSLLAQAFLAWSAQQTVMNSDILGLILLHVAQLALPFAGIGFFRGVTHFSSLMDIAAGSSILSWVYVVFAQIPILIAVNRHFVIEMSTLGYKLQRSPTSKEDEPLHGITIGDSSRGALTRGETIDMT